MGQNFDYSYQVGFGNHFATEILPGALPQGQNSPQKVPYGLIAELISGSAFTAARAENKKTWVYRRLPSVVQGDYSDYEQNQWVTAPDTKAILTPQALRWNPMDLSDGEGKDFLDGVKTFLTTGDSEQRQGSSVHLYACKKSMGDKVLCNADGDLLLVPQQGSLLVKTELGCLTLQPHEIAVLPRGIKFKIDLIDGAARGYVLEVYGRPLQLPELGPIGSNGLANPRDFLIPTASCDEQQKPHNLITKYGGRFFRCSVPHSPFDVVAWHGNYVPFKYDLRLFNTVNTVSFDHPDPSIFTVLTSPSDHSGVANVDFVIFPPRWMVAEHTFRPPYFHRNIMSEYMGLIHGVYDAKPAGGFEPGGGSLHSCMTPHGPESKAYHKATEIDLKPEFMADTMAFMFESFTAYKLTEFAAKCDLRQEAYTSCWSDIKPSFISLSHAERDNR